MKTYKMLKMGIDINVKVKNPDVRQIIMVGLFEEESKPKPELPGQIALYGIKGQPYSQKHIDIVVDAVNKLIVRVEDLYATRPVTQITTCFGYTMSEIHQIIDFAKSRGFKLRNKKNLTKPKK